ncbi:MotA/TolQ/ExbB proton channel family protein [Nitrosospira sp. Nsp1]|uniref:MotA/TolQ/ExbB proton channel family protein n=1 Tax=Nitrosospira sp. Nsp1 TaxID=136547 RepID=UPI00089274A6|nr:MotA/TolQ/ExbB proton channel family protein [Nitrosospira sp. Nsp1]SCX59496.1 biopolymer transport protein ExbB [Nitrosospira sp. Nsp1]
MFALIQAAGWPIWPLILASIVAMGIIGERMWALRLSMVTPRDLLPKVVYEYRNSGVSADMIARLQKHSPLGQIFAAGLRNDRSTREVMKESIEEAGHAVSHDLEHYLTTLGTIASMSPLMGLFGTLVGMIEIFGVNSPTGGSDPAQLAHGISVALYNAAFGILVAIPSMMFYRHFRAKVDALVIEMELQALKLVEIVHGERQDDSPARQGIVQPLAGS